MSRWDGWLITGKALSTLGVLIIFLSPVLFARVVVPVLGWEFIVGHDSVHYNADHTRIDGVTNPGAWVMWWILIGMIGYVVVLLGKKMQVSDEGSLPGANRRLCLLLVGIVCLAWWLCQVNG